MRVFFLVEFFNDLVKFNNLNTQKEKTKMKKTNMYDRSSKYIDEYFNYFPLKHILMNAMIYQMQKEVKQTPNNVYDYYEWYKEKELDDLPPLEGDKEEVKEGKGLKILTPNKLLTRLPILLAQIKAGNNLNTLKNELRQILYLLYQHNKITKKVYNNLIKSF